VAHGDRREEKQTCSRPKLRGFLGLKVRRLGAHFKLLSNNNMKFSVLLISAFALASYVSARSGHSKRSDKPCGNVKKVYGICANSGDCCSRVIASVINF
jgi:hypothetical protein